MDDDCVTTGYRAATAADIELVAQLHTRSWRENYRGSYSDAFLDNEVEGERLQAWRERLTNPADNQFTLLALDETTLVGFVCAFGAHDAAWGSLVDNLHVAREFQGRGIGRSLLAQASSWLGDRHADVPVHLYVLEANLPARGFYDRLGGATDGQPILDVHGGAAVRALRYTWPRPAALGPHGGHFQGPRP